MFAAPMGMLVRVVTLMVGLFLLALSSVAIFGMDQKELWVRTLVAMTGPSILGISALFAVRGYELRMGSLIVRRPLWETIVPLEGLTEVEVNPEAMRGSLRLLGNGGLFAFAGWFRNRRLGMYRAFVSNPARSVVLRFPKRTVVVSPDRPEEFAAAIKALARLK